VDAIEPGRGHAIEPQRRARPLAIHAPGEQKPHSIPRIEPAGRERDRCGRRRVEPLHVVHRQEHGFASAERAQRRAEGGGHGAVVRRRPVEVADQQCDLERAPLRTRQLGQQLVEHRRQQVPDRDERQSRLLARGRGAEHAIAALSGEVEAGLPDRGLADPELALEQQRARSVLGRGVEKARDLCEFRFPADDLGVGANHGGAAPILSAR
jgi:hypothetical protein